jgi:hypothetical protein
MATLADAQRLIDELLVARLKAAGCVRGRFAVTGAAAQFSLTGERADGKAMLFREFNDHLFNRLMGDYLESGYPAGRACLTVDIDVATGHCTHQLTTETQQATIILDKQAQELRARKNRRSRAPYGTQLAEQVADVRGARPNPSTLSPRLLRQGLRLPESRISLRRLGCLLSGGAHVGFS